MGVLGMEDDGWEALPSARSTVETYASEVQHQRAVGRNRPPHAHLLDHLQHAHHAAASEPSAPPGDAAAWGPGGSCGGEGDPPYSPAAHHAAFGANALMAGAGVPPSSTQVDVLLLDPPTWLPDSYALHCGSCALPFKPLLRLRHHCRLCGKVFCNACCARRLLLPPRYNQREPQRVCEMCRSLLEPLQPYLVGALSRSVQPPVHDALDAVSLRR